MRRAKRKMKGVNLQYVADRRVFFEDVAGIGEAKVGPHSEVTAFASPEATPHPMYHVVPELKN